MKKRILSLLLALLMCLTMFPASSVLASDELVTATENEDWSFQDLLKGTYYGIFPSSWTDVDITDSITQGQLRLLLSKARVKILDTEYVTENPDTIYRFSKEITVEKVLEAYYEMLSGMTFTSDIGTKGKTALEFMKENGIYTGQKGEQKLTDICTLEQACVVSARIVTYVYDKLDAASKGFLWVTKSGGNTVYMLGTVHVASSDIYPFSQDMVDAYESSDALVGEINLFDIEGAYNMTLLAVYADGTTLKDHISEETYNKVITLCAKYGYPEEIISMYKPWFVYTLLGSISYTNDGDAEAAAENASMGIDMFFLTDAYLNGKTIKEIEGYEFQGKMLDSFSPELQEYLLNNTVDEINEGITTKSNASSLILEMYLELWKAGDVESFLEYTVTDDTQTSDMDAKELELSKEFNDKLLTQRDKGMADYIDNLLKAEGNATYFVIVGSAHYISDHSVLDILKEKGYEITQIK